MSRSAARSSAWSSTTSTRLDASPPGCSTPTWSGIARIPAILDLRYSGRSWATDRIRPMRSDEIRSRFVAYFEARDHLRLASGSLVPPSWDQSVLLTTAGMQPLMRYFTREEEPPAQRAVTVQKGFRTVDIDHVGTTARHLTFFEMLGNFSFGDYFKENAIELAWKLVTEGFDLPKNRLLVTVYSEDEEAATLWKKIAGFSDDKIIRIPTSDNFWQMGDTGPCGPCSEIFYDHGESIPGGPPGSADQDGDRFIEIWNLVFMQYEQIEPG